MDALIIYKLYIKNPDQKTQKIINIQRISMISICSELKKNMSSEIPIFFWMLCEMLEHQPSSY